MKKRLLFSAIALALVFTVGPSIETRAQTVSASIPDGKVARGKTVVATVVLDIPEELHTNSNTPGSEYAIPTTVRATAEGVKLGPVVYPKGHEKKFEFSESMLSVYEGRVEFTFEVSVPDSYKGSQVAIEVSVRYQACTNEVCYPPKTKKVSLVADVR
ncbi:MAG: protein-disulfide reductase DsbD N-terminal domain-containing protein [Pyrinomonadaceae bacterium]